MNTSQKSSAIRALGWSFASFLSASQVFAQQPVSTSYYQCKAECFSIGGDGKSVSYSGGWVTPAFGDKERAFRELKKQFCAFPNLLMTRTFLGFKTDTHERNVTEITNETTEYRVCWRNQRVTRNTQQIESYRIMDEDTSAQFDIQTATPDNACDAVPAPELPPLRYFEGNHVL